LSKETLFVESAILDIYRHFDRHLQTKVCGLGKTNIKNNEIKNKWKGNRNLREKKKGVFVSLYIMYFFSHYFKTVAAFDLFSLSLFSRYFIPTGAW